MYFSKKVYVIVFIIAFLSINKLYAVAGFYFAPKMSFLIEGERDNDRFNNSLGGGLSIGYDFFRISRKVPIRLEAEYLGRYDFTAKENTLHSFLANIYYDINFFFVKTSDLTSVTAKEIFETKPFMSLYLGLSFGARLKSSKLDKWYEYNSFQTAENVVLRNSFIFGASVGIGINCTKYFALDLSYRFLIGPVVKVGNDFILAFRFTMPD